MKSLKQISVIEKNSRKSSNTLCYDIIVIGTSMGGFHALKQLISEFPAVTLTAYATKEDVSRALSAGFDTHLAKPFNTVDLFCGVVNMAKSKR